VRNSSILIRLALLDFRFVISGVNGDRKEGVDASAAFVSLSIY
jgi:hypothetical protein